MERRDTSLLLLITLGGMAALGATLVVVVLLNVV